MKAQAAISKQVRRSKERFSAACRGGFFKKTYIVDVGYQNGGVRRKRWERATRLSARPNKAQSRSRPCRSSTDARHCKRLPLTTMSAAKTTCLSLPSIVSPDKASAIQAFINPILGFERRQGWRRTKLPVPYCAKRSPLALVASKARFKGSKLPAMRRL